LQIVDGPTAVPASNHALLLWVKDDLFVATPNPGLLSQMGSILEHPAANPFKASAFHNRVAAVYQDGAGWLFSGDFKKILAQHGSSPDRHAEALGILDFQDLVVNRREGTGRTET